MKHDESTDVKRLAFVGVKTVITPTTNGTVKCLVISPIQRSNLGIKQWGRVDYLTKYCHYRVVTGVASNATVISGNKRYNNNNEDNTPKKSARQAKKEQKAPKLTNKKKK